MNSTLDETNVVVVTARQFSKFGLRISKTMTAITNNAAKPPARI